MKSTTFIFIRSICIVLAIFFLLLAIKSAMSQNIEKEKNVLAEEVQHKIELHSQIEIVDGCEYIVFCRRGWEDLNEGRISITSVHKANCKNH